MRHSVRNNCKVRENEKEGFGKRNKGLEREGE